MVFVEASLLRQEAEERRIWNVRFIRDFNDWEMDEGLLFFVYWEPILLLWMLETR